MTLKVLREKATFMRTRYLFLPILAISLMLLSSARAATFVYVGNSDSQDITMLELRDSGELTPVATVAVPGPVTPGGSLPLAVSPDKRFLFAALRSQPFSVATFSIHPKTGKLAYVGNGPLADNMAYIATDRTGRFLLGASYQGSKVTVSPITANGLIGKTRQTVPTAPNANCVLTDPSNRYVLHTSLGGDLVYQEKFAGETGQLSPNAPPTVSVRQKAGPRHLTFSPSENFVYLICELDGSLYVFPFDGAAGTLKKEIQVASALPEGFSGKPWAADIHLTPNGKFLYASERASSTLAAFRVDPKNGTLTFLNSFPTVKQPRAFNIDPTGGYLLAVGQLSNSLRSYAIDGSNGKLITLKDYTMGRNPNWVEIISLP
jgi:6-phosphogluconolactonase